MKTFKLKRIRGRTLGYYIAVVAFGVGSTFYIFKPVTDILEARSDSYLNRGKPKRLLDDDGKAFNEEKNLTPKNQNQLKRLEQLEKAQLSGTSPPSKKHLD